MSKKSAKKAFKKVGPLALIDPASASVAHTMETVKNTKQEQKDAGRLSGLISVNASNIILDAAAKEAAAAEAERLKKKKGHKGTIATGPLGITTDAETYKTKLG